MNNIYELGINDLQGNTFSTCASLRAKFSSWLTLPVNVASPRTTKAFNSFTTNFSSQGFSVVGFPCNQFGGQEPGAAQEIADFCTTRFGVTFPMHEKIKVNGPQTHPLFEKLKKTPRIAGHPKNKVEFTKFLIDKQGQTIKRFVPKPNLLTSRSTFSYYSNNARLSMRHPGPFLGHSVSFPLFSWSH